MAAWAGLRDDLVRRIAIRLPCLAHRAVFAAVCLNWRAVARELPVPPQLPWLLLPSAAAQEPCFFCLRCMTTHRAVLPADVPGARCCSSGPGGLLFLALQQSRGYAIHELHAGVRFLLPEILRTPQPVDDHGMIIHAAHGAATPDGVYFAALVEGSASTIAFWRIHEGAAEHWSPPMPAELHLRNAWPGMLPRDRIADMIYYSGHGLAGFHVLTDSEELLVYAPHRGPDHALTTRLVTYRFPNHEITSPLRAGEVYTLTRYLVAYANELLMVVRFVSPEGTTEAFVVLKLTPAAAQVADGGIRLASWDPMYVIPSGLIFLGRCSSRAYGTHGFDVDGVYFLDDTTSSHDAARALEPPATRLYPCSDMGWLPLTSHNIQRIFPAWSPSEYSRAVWLFQ